MKYLKYTLVAILLLVIVLAISITTLRAGKTPSNDRDWSVDQALLPAVSIDEKIITIEHVRDFSYRSTTEYDVAYLSKTVDLDHIVSVDYLVEPFGTQRGAAHTLLTFGFDSPSGTEYIAVSVEIRKEKGETFSPIKGILNEYELMYIVGTEDDIIKLRTNYRKDDVYLYPIKTTKDRMQALFLSMIERIDTLENAPEFYNTVTNNCTSNIRDHVNEIAEGRVPWTYTTFLPGYSDKRAYELGLIDTDLSFEEAKAYFYITDLAQTVGEDENFSATIRSRR